MKPYRPHTECPECGYGPLHHKSTSYNGGRVVVSYRCALCQHAFDAEHEARENQGGWRSDQSRGSLEESPQISPPGGKRVGLNPKTGVPGATHDILHSAPGDPSEKSTLCLFDTCDSRFPGRECGELCRYKVQIYHDEDYISTPGAKT